MEEPPVILVVEDDEPIESSVEDALRDGGFEPVALPKGMKTKRTWPPQAGTTGDHLNVDGRRVAWY